MCVSRLTVAAAVTALVAGTPALADVTPQQVWDELQGYLESFGYEVTARETTDGDRLVALSTRTRPLRSVRKARNQATTGSGRPLRRILA